MIDQQFVTGHSAKHYKSEFIFKLVDIMKNFPGLVSWADNGSCIEFFKVFQIQQTVLPLYFRHSKFESFLRQLHLYNFRQNKTQKNRLVFEHSIFKQGNQDKFFIIQRTKHKKQKQSLMKQLQNNDVLNKISQNKTLAQNQKQILKVIFSYKLIVLQKQRNLKQKLIQFTESLKSNRNKKIKQNITLLDQQIKLQLQSNKKFSKSIDLFITSTLNQRINQQQQHIQKTQHIQNKNIKTNQTKYNQIQPYIHSSIYQNNSIFKSQKVGQNNPQTQSLCHGNNFFNFQRLYMHVSNQNNSIKDSLSDYVGSDKNNYKCSSSSTSQNKLIMNEIRSQDQEYFGIRNQQNIPIGVFNLNREPSLVFMPLPVYNRSVMSQFFDRQNKHSIGSFEMSQHRVEQKCNNGGQYKSKSQQFDICANKGIKRKQSKRVRNQQLQQKQESEISFMNDN